MSTPYPEQVVPGGVLVYPAIRSPNFVHGEQGWSINVDGSAEFHSIIIPTTPGLVVTFSATPPSNPNTGDLWYDVSNGNLEHQWNGSVWIPFQVGTGAVAAGAITGAQIANGTITAPLVDFTAQDIGAVNVTYSKSAPPNPNIGDVWIQVAS